MTAIANSLPACTAFAIAGAYAYLDLIALSVGAMGIGTLLSIMMYGIHQNALRSGGDR